MTNCSVDDCDKPVKRFGFCYGHYMKNWRYGTPTPTHRSKVVSIVGARFGTLVVIERVGQQWRCVCDCGESRTVNAGDLNRYGDKNTCGVIGRHLPDDVSYRAVHDRVKRALGRAADFPCVDCGCDAKQWSYDRADDRERVQHGLSVNAIPYSTDLSRYQPRCIPCHKRFDLDAIRRTRASA